MRKVLWVALAAGLALTAGCVGTGSPWTKELRVAVVSTTADGAEEVPVTSASVTLTRGSALGGGTGGSTGGTQTQSTGSDGVAVFPVEPGYAYSATITATGYTTGQVSLEVGHLATQTITRKVVLTSTGGE
jgi:hypothetical protein